MNRFYFFLAMAAVVFAGCSGGEKTLKGSLNPEPVKTSGNKPDWVSDSKVYWTDGNRMYIKVSSEDEADLSFARKGLDGEAYRQLIRALQIRAGLEFDEAMKGAKSSQNTIGHARQYVVNAIGDVKFSGLMQNEEYWAQYERNEGMNTVSYVYTIFGLYSIHEDEVQRARQDAWAKASETAERQVDRDAKQLLEEAKKRFLKGGRDNQ
jgi:hypothetical protein